MTPQNQGGRPQGSKNAKPSATAVAGYYKLLANAAASGDVTAAAALIDLHERHCSDQAGIKPNGF